MINIYHLGLSQYLNTYLHKDLSFLHYREDSRGLVMCEGRRGEVLKCCYVLYA